MFPLALPWETLRSSGNKINCFPRDQSLSVYSFDDVMFRGTSKENLFVVALCFSCCRLNETTGKRLSLLQEIRNEQGVRQFITALAISLNR